MISLIKLNYIKFHPLIYFLFCLNWYAKAIFGVEIILDKSLFILINGRVFRNALSVSSEGLLLNLRYCCFTSLFSSFVIFLNFFKIIFIKNIEIGNLQKGVTFKKKRFLTSLIAGYTICFYYMQIIDCLSMICLRPIHLQHSRIFIIY